MVTVPGRAGWPGLAKRRFGGYAKIGVIPDAANLLLDLLFERLDAQER